MTRHHHSQFLDLYCYLPNEFLISYPQPQTSLYCQQKKRKIHRNTNALESSSSMRLSKYKPKTLLHHKDEIHKRRITKKIMSIESPDQEVEFYMIKESTMNDKHHYSLQMADGDKRNQNILDEFQQQRFTNHQEHMIHTDIIRPIPCKPSFTNRLKQSSSTLPLNRTSTWRKLQANITPSYYNHIQQFQRERQQKHRSLLVPHPIMLSPLQKRLETENSETSKTMSNITNSYASSTSLLIDSPTSLAESNSSHRLIPSMKIDQQVLDDDDDKNSNTPILNRSSPQMAHQSEIYSKDNIWIENKVSNSLTISAKQILEDALGTNPSSHEIEEFQPVIEIASPSQVPSVFLNDILSSFFPTISTPNVFGSQHHRHEDIVKTPCMLFDNTANMTELLIIGPPPPPSSFIESNFIFENHPSKIVHSFSESIEELCRLIRKLLQHELTEQKTTHLQATITNQLAILLTYLAIPNNQKIISELISKNTIERMTSTDDNDFSPRQPLMSTTGTQTDIEWIIELNNQISKTMLMSTKQEEIINIPLTSNKVTSQTELMSTSVTLHLPGRRPHHALSDTFIYHIHHHQRYSSSYHQLLSFSETTIHSLMHRFHQHRSIKEETKHIEQKFKHYIELESSNTCLEASTEFTPSFLLTTINNSKYDDDDQTEQFGIDTEKQDYSIINENHEKIDTLTFNSIEKENYDSLDLDIEQDNEERPLFTSITKMNNLFLNNITSLSLDDNLVSPVVNRLNNKIHSYQWQVPILPKKANSIDLIYEKRTAKIDFKHLKIRSNSNNGINILGKRVRIKSNSSLRDSISTIKTHLYQQQSKKSATLNYNNNCNDSIRSLASSTSIDSLCSIDTDTLDKSNADQCEIFPKRFRSSINPSKSEFNDKLDSNITLAENILDMLDSINNNNNNDLSIKKIDVLHKSIRQFLIELDALIHHESKKVIY